jgi:hypothetical protein
VDKRAIQQAVTYIATFANEDSTTASALLVDDNVGEQLGNAIVDLVDADLQLVRKHQTQWMLSANLDKYCCSANNS